MATLSFIVKVARIYDPIHHSKLNNFGDNEEVNNWTDWTLFLLTFFSKVAIMCLLFSPMPWWVYSDVGQWLSLGDWQQWQPSWSQLTAPPSPCSWSAMVWLVGCPLASYTCPQHLPSTSVSMIIGHWLAVLPSWVAGLVTNTFLVCFLFAFDTEKLQIVRKKLYYWPDLEWR